MEAASRGHTATVLALIAVGADINLQDNVSSWHFTKRARGGVVTTGCTVRVPAATNVYHYPSIIFVVDRTGGWRSCTPPITVTRPQYRH
jgi:hypothetical protein